MRPEDLLARLEAGYEYDPMYGRLCNERDQLKAENANLREDLEFERSENGWAREFLNRMGQKCGTKDCLSLVAYVTKLEADNAKLRELVSDVYTLHWNGLDCTECPWFDECDTTGGCPWLSILADHMRELGVEVDG